ncbi:MAG: pyridoxal phosphate-dependent aminotransferase, partial [Eubacteriales bacterium]
ILNPGDEVIIPAPYWVSYPVMVQMADGVPVHVEASEDEDFIISAEKIEAAISEKTKAIIINSPSNPSGAVYSMDDLKAIAEVCKKHNIMIVSDEIYDELTYEGEHASIAAVDEQTKALTLLVNGLSKSYSMTGWRVGYVACDKEIAKVIKAYQSHTASNPNTMAQYASVAALNSDGSDIMTMKRAFDERRKRLHLLINDVDGLSCHMPKGAFYIMMNISKTFGKSYEGKKITSSLDFSKLLLEGEKVAVVPGSAFGADEFVRLSYAVSMANIDEGIRRITAFVKALQ